MREQIQKALDSLVGMALWSSGRAADLEWFQFGQRRTVTARNGTKEVGEYALHIQCGWRMRCGDQVVVGGRDLYYPPEGSEGPMTTSTGTSRGQQVRQAHCGAIPERDATVLGAES